MIEQVCGADRQHWSNIEVKRNFVTPLPACTGLDVKVCNYSGCCKASLLMCEENWRLFPNCKMDSSITRDFDLYRGQCCLFPNIQRPGDSFIMHSKWNTGGKEQDREINWEIDEIAEGNYDQCSSSNYWKEVLHENTSSLRFQMRKQMTYSYTSEIKTYAAMEGRTCPSVAASQGQSTLPGSQLCWRNQGNTKGKQTIWSWLVIKCIKKHWAFQPLPDSLPADQPFLRFQSFRCGFCFTQP